MSTVNERFFELRTALGLTQAELGDIIDIKKATISMIESGKANLSKRARLKLLQTYNVNPDWLDNGNGTMFVEDLKGNEEDLSKFLSDVLQLDDSDIRKKIIMAMAKVPSEYWDAIAGTIETFVDTFKSSNSKN